MVSAYLRSYVSRAATWMELVIIPSSIAAAYFAISAQKRAAVRPPETS